MAGIGVDEGAADLGLGQWIRDVSSGMSLYRERARRASGVRQPGRLAQYRRRKGEHGPDGLLLDVRSEHAAGVSSGRCPSSEPEARPASAVALAST